MTLTLLKSCGSPARRLGILVVLAALLVVARAAAEEGKSGVSATHIKLPTGPGSLEGVGENAEPNVSMGIVAYGIPISLPVGHRGLAPTLHLAYSSSGGASEVGMGWSLATPNIERMTSRGLPHYGKTDAFAANGQQELVRVGKSDVFRARDEGEFARYSWLNAADGKAGYWVAEYPDGRVGYFGADAKGQLDDSSRIETPDGTYSYLMVELVDTVGHSIHYSYDKPEADGRPYLSRIDWGFFGSQARYSAILKYEERSDVISDGKPGVEVRLARRLRDLEVTVRGALLRRYHLAYEAYASSGGFTRLAAVQTFGAVNQLPYPIAFHFEYTGSFDPSCQAQAGCLKPYVKTLGSVGVDFKAGSADLIDINGDHLPDVVDTQRGEHSFYVQRLEAGEAKLDGPIASATAGSGSMLLNSAAVRLVDLDGNGAADMVDGLNKRVLFNDDDGDWRPMEAFDAQLPDFAGDADLRFLDVNYDRAIDAVHVNRAGSWFFENDGNNQFSKQARDLELNGLGFVQDKLQLSDFNGDGMQDLAQPLPGGVAYRMNLGNGRFGAVIEMLGLPQSWSAAEPEFVDLNGDSLSDAVVVLGSEVQYCLNENGRSFAELHVIADVSGLPERTPGTSIRFADMNASGSEDIVWITPAGVISYLELFPRRPNLLARIDNGIGKVIELQYGTTVEHMARDAASAPWDQRLPHVMITLDRIVVSDTLSGVQQAQDFHYRNGFFDRREHQFRGFREVEATTSGDTSVEPGMKLYRFEVGEVDRYRKGLLLEEETLSGGRSIQVTRSTFDDCTIHEAEDTAQPVRFICAKQQEQELREGRPEAEWVTTRTSTDYDGYGNAVLVAKEGVVSVGGGACAPCSRDASESHGQYCGKRCLGDETFTETTFVVPGAKRTAGRWLLRAPQRVVTYSVADQAEPLLQTEEHTYYDGPAFEGLPLGQLDLGLVTRKTQKRDSASSIDEERNELDAHGNVIASLDPNGHRRELGYDDAGLSLLHEDIVFNDAERAEPYSLRSSVEYHPLFELPVSSAAWLRVIGGKVVTDARDRQTLYDYDEFGRLTRLAKPGDTLASPTHEYQYDLKSPISRIVDRTRSRAGAAPDLESIQCFDGLGREVQKKDKLGAGAYQASGYVEFGAQGKPSRSFQPYRTASAECEVAAPIETVPFEATKYDALGRALDLTVPDEADYPQYGKMASHTTTQYVPLATVVYDAEDAEPLSPHYDTPTTTRVDGLGRTMRIERLLERGSEPVVTTFGYSALGYFNLLIDDRGNVKTQEHDLLGRVCTVTDPDTGTTKLSYDDAGNVLTSTDARGAVAAFAYDEANRRVSQHDTADPTHTSITWFYDGYADCSDQDCSVGEGELLAIRYPLAENFTGSTVGEDRFGFDARGRQRFFSRTLADHEFRFTFGFDNADRSTFTRYPNDVRVHHQYDALGRATKATAELADNTPVPVLKQAAYNDRQLLERLEQGNGATTTLEYDGALRLRRLATETPKQKLQGYTYARDRSDHILSVTDELAEDHPSATAEYRYDALYRLSSAVLDSGRPHSATLTFEYDTIDNLLSKSLVTVGKNTSQSYSYGSAKRGPHAATQAGDRDYRYDEAGNMSWRHQQQLEWDYVGRLVSAKHGSRVLDAIGYDASRERVTKQEGSSLTFFITPDFEVRDGISTVYVSGPSGNIAKLESADSGPALLGDTAQEGAPDGVVKASDAYASLVAGQGQRALAQLASSARRSLLERGQRITYLHHDHLGNASVTTDEAGQVVQRTQHYPFGEVRYQSAFQEEHSFTGKEQDASSGLSYHGARYLDVELGRWVSADPLFATLGEAHAERLGEAFGYAYVSNNPITSVDEDGLVQTVGEMIESAGVSAAESGSDLETAGWAALSAVWEVFGAESVSKVSASVGTNRELTKSDIFFAGVEVLSLGKGGAIRQGTKNFGVAVSLGLKRGKAMTVVKELGRTFWDGRAYSTVRKEMNTVVKRLGWTTDHAFVQQKWKWAKGITNARINLWDMPDMKWVTGALGSKQGFNTFIGGTKAVQQTFRAITSISIVATTINDAKSVYRAATGASHDKKD